MLGEWVDAQDARRMGIVADVFGIEEFEARIAERAARLASQPPLALAEIKRALNASLEKTMEEALADEAAAQGSLCESDDFGEAMSAFFEKREPSFSGR